MIYVVLRRNSPKAKWESTWDGIFTSERLALNFIECSIASNSKWEFSLVASEPRLFSIQDFQDSATPNQ